MLRFIFACFFPFYFFFIRHSNAIHRKICVNDFSGNTASRILKFGTNTCIGNDVFVLRESSGLCVPLLSHLGR